MTNSDSADPDLAETAVGAVQGGGEQDATQGPQATSGGEPDAGAFDAGEFVLDHDVDPPEAEATDDDLNRGFRSVVGGAAVPPPAPTASPLTATAHGAARKTTTSATSSAVTMRPGWCPRRGRPAPGPRCARSRRRGRRSSRGVRSVSTRPGCTTVTPMPCGPSSSARFAVSAATATLRMLPGIEPVRRALRPRDVDDPAPALRRSCAGQPRARSAGSPSPWCRSRSRPRRR